MKSPAATLRRLLQSLEELGVREDGALAARDGIAFLALERSAEPLVQRVVTLTAEPVDDVLRTRGQSLVASRSERRVRLMHLLETMRDELGGLDAARDRARALRPAYVASRVHTDTRPAFAACG
ncbi:hypothetical protein [Rariglobus hedericola]|uniref:Uncharacterized protein n=1 Tax=Rariglobus hedericola TaxID=2597822 RepID=A0A556QPM2_9BACT|nr:hypothetical protein [Rariglobus hedericola]TSJ78585.1 hypothetical protein FPL22_04595 [Rariglobus hedericola]